MFIKCEDMNLPNFDYSRYHQHDVHLWNVHFAAKYPNIRPCATFVISLHATLIHQVRITILLRYQSIIVISFCYWDMDLAIRTYFELSWKCYQISQSIFYISNFIIVEGLLSSMLVRIVSFKKRFKCFPKKRVINQHRYRF